jgi:ABC-type multidrug transport system ATPase subunit
MSLLKASYIEKSWNETSLFNSVSHNFNRGEVYQLRAENGKGKTTFLKICAGLLTPDVGEISCSSPRGWCSSKGNGEIPRLTGRENIELMMKIFKTKNNNINQWRELTSFNDALNTEYGKCSDGMKMLISLYISTISDPKIIFWDEPFAHLSSDNSQKILNDWQRYSGAEALVFSSHETISDFKGEVISL